MMDLSSLSFDSFEDLLDCAEAMGIKPAETKQRKTAGASASDKALENFRRVMEFVEANGREPDRDRPDERKLAMVLHGERTRPELQELLAPHDRLGLLTGTFRLASQQQEPEPPQPETKFDSFEALLDGAAAMGMGDDIQSDVFNLKNVPAWENQGRDSADEIAVRTRCEDFADYEKLFMDKRRQISDGTVKTPRFTSTEQIFPGQFYVLKGVLCYVDKVLQESTGKVGRDDPRLRVIFDNGTESNLLKRSLAKALYADKNGRAVIQQADEFALQEKGAKTKASSNHAKGWIYILASESTEPALAQYKNTGHLVKIGYTTQEVEERIANAEKEPTYLNAPVKLLAKYECFNMNVHQFEGLIHAFLHGVQLKMKVMSANGKRHLAREWFRIDLKTAMAVCEHIIRGDIHKYRMDDVNAILVER